MSNLDPAISSVLAAKESALNAQIQFSVAGKALMGGRVVVEDAPLGGARFTVSWPAT